MQIYFRFERRKHNNFDNKRLNDPQLKAYKALMNEIDGMQAKVKELEEHNVKNEN